jgi:PAS domain S-box-containing protein
LSYIITTMKRTDRENKIKELELEVSNLKSGEKATKREAKEVKKQALEESDAKFLALANYVPAYIAYVNADTLRYEFVNDLYVKSFDIPKEKIIGSRVKDIIGETNFKFALKYINEVKSGKSASYENTFNLTSGKRWLQVNYSPVFDTNNKVIGIALVNHDITERKQIENALHESEKRLKFYMDNSPMAIVECDSDFVVTRWTGESEKIFGWKAEEVIGKKIMDLNLLYEPDLPLGEEVTKKIKSGLFNQVVSCNRNYRKDGSVIDCEWYNIVLIDEKGKMQSVLSKVLDITERKKGEENLKTSEMLLENVFNSTENLILVVDRDLKVLMSNWKSPIYAGCTEFPIGSHCYEAFIHRDTPCDPCHVYSVFDTGKPIRTEYYNQYTKLFKEVNAYPIFDNNKNVTMVVENVQDITERKLGEKVLQDSEEKFRSIMENSADAIFITNPQGMHVYTNKAVSAMLGYTSEEMKSKSFAEVSPLNKIEEYYKFFEQILNEGKGFREIELVKKDGNYISTEINSVLLPDGTVYGSCRDITERKYAESEIIKAKEKAEESDRLKSAFLTNMSHEIRTPMNGILGFTELLKEPNLTSDELQDYIQTIQISGARMLNTINSIVDISKIESGLIDIDIKETNLNEKIEFTYKFFKPDVEIKGLQFLFKNGLPSNEAIIETDNEKLYGILTNLIRNAIKFTFDGSIEFGYEKKGEYIEFFVKDTGIGIPQQQQQLIFERFRQGSESHSRGYEGSGLGLSISKSYVEMLGGRIWVESEEGLGSTFYFTIPYIAVTEQEIEIKDAVSAEQKEVQLRNLKILIVEDDEISYSLLTRTLNKISKEVLHAITGVQAIEACRSNPDLDLILMDIRMPEMDGNEATRQIRQFNKNVIIIAQTAFAFAGDSEKAINAGCNDYISKPINMTLLHELIKKHFNR